MKRAEGEVKGAGDVGAGQRAKGEEDNQRNKHLNRKQNHI
jgi:hypothetical protein